MQKIIFSLLRYTCCIAILTTTASSFANDEVENPTQTEIAPEQTNTDDKQNLPPEYLPAGSDAEEESDSDCPCDNDCGCDSCCNCHDDETEEEKEKETDSVSASVKSASSLMTTQILRSEHNGAFLPINGIGPWGEAIRLRDGSIWIINPADMPKLINWCPEQIVVLLPNPDKLSPFRFLLANQNVASTIAVNLHAFLNPPYHDGYNHRILDIDVNLQRIWLADGSIWDVSWWDFSKQCERGDTVIIGINNGARASTMPNILLNCRTLHVMRTHRVF